jgi:inosine-uridine nucleoside N-ribohydrolase
MGKVIGPFPEGNIKIDIDAAQKLFRSGVPLYLIPADSTMYLRLDEVKRKSLFSQGTPLTNSLNMLYLLWGATATPVLFDPMTVGFAVNPKLCPVQPMHIVVDDKGETRAHAEPSNAEVCLHSDTSTFLDYYIGRVAPRMTALRQ